MYSNQKTYVAPAGHKGRGVFANKKLRKNEVIEISPYIELPAKEFNRLSGTTIESYRFGVYGNKCALGLGNLSIYNHDSKPNAQIYVDADTRTLTVQALKTIDKQEEITIHYGYKVQTTA